MIGFILSGILFAGAVYGIYRFAKSRGMFAPDAPAAPTAPSQPPKGTPSV